MTARADALAAAKARALALVDTDCGQALEAFVHDLRAHRELAPDSVTWAYIARNELAAGFMTPQRCRELIEGFL